MPIPYERSRVVPAGLGAARFWGAMVASYGLYLGIWPVRRILSGARSGTGALNGMERYLQMEGQLWWLCEALVVIWVGVGVFRGRQWARVLGAVLAGGHLIASLSGFLPELIIERDRATYALTVEMFVGVKLLTDICGPFFAWQYLASRKAESAFDYLNPEGSELEGWSKTTVAIAFYGAMGLLAVTADTLPIFVHAVIWGTAKAWPMWTLGTGLCVVGGVLAGLAGWGAYRKSRRMFALAMVAVLVPMVGYSVTVLFTPSKSKAWLMEPDKHGSPEGMLVADAVCLAGGNILALVILRERAQAGGE